jgi:predicted nucleic acid-binding protein
MFLVDTNVVSELTRKQPSVHVTAWLQRQPAVVISVVTIEELSYGIARARSPRRRQLNRWLDELVGAAAAVLDVTEAVGRSAGELRAAREDTGRRVAQADMLIAATALVHGLVLATRNVRDFSGCGLAIVDPFAP